MKKREYNVHKKALVERCMLMSLEGIQMAILEQITATIEPQGATEGDTGETMPYILFEAMLIALERKMGKKAFAEWLAKV